LHSKNKSLDSFDCIEDELYSTKCSKQKVYRNLHHPDGFRLEYFDYIAKALNLDPNYLSGRLYHHYDYNFESIEEYISRMNWYPYDHKNYIKYKKQNIKTFLSSILALFDISYTQFEEFDFDKQISFQKELLAEISTTIGKYFDRDDAGNKEMYQLYKILDDLDSYAEDHYIEEYVETVLRPEYLKRPPIIYTREGKKVLSKEEIRNMAYDSIFELERFLEPPTEDELLFESKYKVIECNCDD